MMRCRAHRPRLGYCESWSGAAHTESFTEVERGAPSPGAIAGRRLSCHTCCPAAPSGAKRPVAAVRTWLRRAVRVSGASMPDKRCHV